MNTIKDLSTAESAAMLGLSESEFLALATRYAIRPVWRDGKPLWNGDAQVVLRAQFEADRLTAEIRALAKRRHAEQEQEHPNAEFLHSIKNQFTLPQG